MTLSSECFRLGDWLVDPTLSRVTNGNKTVHLEPRAMEVLVYLAGRADELVCKQELIDHVWQAEVVAHGSLTGIIAQLRSALCDNCKHSKYIETIHTKGYRVIADVVTVPTAPGLRDSETAGDRGAGLVEEPKGMAQAEAGLLHTIEVARVRGTTYTELRAATRLAGLWKDQGRIDEARALLQPIVAGFTEGIDTLPLLEAKALLWDMTGGTVE
ncbi:MAG: winged helix-turn-helix domain-containing protein [Acidobacteriota bacterium]